MVSAAVASDGGSRELKIHRERLRNRSQSAHAFGQSTEVGRTACGNTEMAMNRAELSLDGPLSLGTALLGVVELVQDVPHRVSAG